MIQALIKDIISASKAIHSPSLHTGWAGYAVALFVAARSLKDPTLEDTAFEILQKALLYNTQNDPSFEEGQAGIAYALAYLIREGYIEGDFDDLWGEHIEHICQKLSVLELTPNTIALYHKMPLALSMIQEVTAQSIGIDRLINRLIESIELYLFLQFQDWRDSAYIGNRSQVLSVFRWYLIQINKINKKPSLALLESYCTLYKEHFIESSACIGGSLLLLGDKLHNALFTNTAQLNLFYSLRQWNLDYHNLPTLILDLYVLKTVSHAEFKNGANHLEKTLQHMPMTAGYAQLLYTNVLLNSNFIF